MNRSGEIWLLGGTGDVGRRVAGFLARGQGAAAGARIVLASRHADQSGRIARQIGPGVRAVVFDVNDNSAATRIPPGAIVVNLTEATPPALARAIVERGGDFIESSASPTYLSDLQTALMPGGFPGCAVLYGGIAPGLTNLAADALIEAAPQTRAVDLITEMGLGRHYGAAATEWFLKSLNRPYPALIRGQVRRLYAGDVSRNVRFHGDAGSRLALGYGFAEQIAIAQKHSLQTVRSLVALDPPWVTQILQGAIALGLGTLMGRAAPRLARWMVRAPAMGATRTRLIVQGSDAAQDPTARVDVVTGDPADAAAVVLAGMVRAVHLRARRSLRSGIRDITDVLTFDAAILELTGAMPETRVLTSWERETGFRASQAV